MSDTPTPEPGSILWVDLTVPEAEEIRDFYAKVVGWKPDPVDMGEYSDYSMKSPKSDMPAAGVCHARGVNKDLPPYWLVYITVNDLEQSMQDTTSLGGRVVVPAKGMGGQGRYCVIQDPAGAVVALFEPAEGEKQ
jgi:uncharacterized protein